MKTCQPSNRLSNLFPASAAEFDSFVDQIFGSGGSRQYTWRLPVAIRETEDRLHVEADAPGVALEDVDITFDKGNLLISLERKAPEVEGKLWHNERGFGKVARSFTLPETADPDSIEATLSNGVLHVTIGKHPEAQPRRIEVKNG